MRSDPAPSARILLVDDHPIVRLGIRQMISVEPGLSICGEEDSVEGALQSVRRMKPDLAIVDLSLTQGNGLELIQALREVSPDLPVLVLSMHDEGLFAERAFNAGARGYIMKQEAVGGLVRAIQHVLSGQIYASERITQSVLENLLGSGGAAPLVGTLGDVGAPGDPTGGRTVSSDRMTPMDPGDDIQLTPREREVLRWLAEGKSNKEVGVALNISVKTVETHRARIMRKLDLHSMTELVRYALRNRLIDL